VGLEAGDAPRLHETAENLGRCIPRSLDRLEGRYTSQAWAKPAKACSARLSSLSTSSKRTLANRGDSRPPSGVPSRRSITTPSAIIPASRYRRISLGTRWSSIFFASLPISPSCFTRSKNFSKSASTTTGRTLLDVVASAQDCVVRTAAKTEAEAVTCSSTRAFASILIRNSAEHLGHLAAAGCVARIRQPHEG